MKVLFSWSRYAILIAVLGLLAGAMAIFVFGGITTGSIILEIFRHGDYSAEGARLVSVEFIELIDVFLLGTVLLITSIGLYQLFIEPEIDLPEWLSVNGLDQLKENLVAVIIVMLAVLFVGEVAGELGEGVDILAYGLAIAAVILAASVAVYIFQRVHLSAHALAHVVETAEPAPSASPHAEQHD